MNRLSVVLALLVTVASASADEAPVLLRIYFDPGSDQLNEAAAEKLSMVLPTLQADYRWQRIEIGGHTDTTADAATNIELSRRRAQAVYDYLAAQGMGMEYMVVRAYGESQPRVRESDESTRAQNRRVELNLLDNLEPGNLTFPAD